MRTSNGCWTCRLRRKRCDENFPVCDACAALDITCHFNREIRPKWMDGDVKQEEMAQKLKRKIKEMADRRRDLRISKQSDSNAALSANESATFSKTTPANPLRTTVDLVEAYPVVHSTSAETSNETSTPNKDPAAQLIHQCHDDRQTRVFEHSDAILFMFYIEKLLPFMFPFYNPSLLDGGKAWILEMMIRRPVVKQAILCQTSYFRTALGAFRDDVAAEDVIMQTQEVFEVLRRALKFMEDTPNADHLRGSVRVMASIIQLYRFEIAVLSFENWQVHLNAALALFTSVVDDPNGAGQTKDRLHFEALVDRLGLSPCASNRQAIPVPTAEQAAFQFSSSLLIFDDIMASILLQRRPRLHGYHNILLQGSEGTEPLINLESVTGVKNLILLAMSKIATLDAWKQKSRADGYLDLVELVDRGLAIEDSLLGCITQLEAGDNPASSNQMLTICPLSKPSTNVGSIVSQIWAHAALCYLSTVVSECQPTKLDIQYYVSQVIQLLTKASDPAIQRSMAWPFCVAGCLADSGQEAQFRGMVEPLPSTLFGTLHKALEIMQNVWLTRETEDFAMRDLTQCFNCEGSLVLLV